MIDKLWANDPARAFVRDWYAGMEQVQIARARDLFQSLNATQQQIALGEIQAKQLDIDQTIELLRGMSG
jgi:hypothetical protein